MKIQISNNIYANIILSKLYSKTSEREIASSETLIRLYSQTKYNFFESISGVIMNTKRDKYVLGERHFSGYKYVNNKDAASSIILFYSILSSANNPCYNDNTWCTSVEMLLVSQAACMQ